MGSCRVDGWYADWEISPGKSFRRKIFEEGISNCDCFFVYLSENSINSHWVQKELDAAFIEESRQKNVDIITFVSDKDVREKLSSDLATLHSPILNDGEYENGLRKLLVAIYEAKIRRVQSDMRNENENEVLKLKNEILRLKNELLSEEASSRNETDREEDEMRIILNKFRSTHFTLLDKDFAALDFFLLMLPEFLVGAYDNGFEHYFGKKFFGIKASEKFKLESGEFSSVLAPLLIYEFINTESTDYGDQWIITPKGKRFARFLDSLEIEE